jgi:predicted ATPase
MTVDSSHQGPKGAEAQEGPMRLSFLRVDGYRALDEFSAHFAELTITIGANASGKSSLFDFLAFVSFAADNPLPPELDPRSGGKTLFHSGGPERLRWVLVMERGEMLPLEYEVRVDGPVGMPRVVSEQLISIVREPDGELVEEFAFLRFKGGKGVVGSAGPTLQYRPDWVLPPNELALRRALDPSNHTLSRFQTYVSEWRFYSGLDVGMASAIRRPVMSEPNPILKEDGSNLSAVLFHLKSEHPEVWEELETHLRSAIPSFQSLTVKPRGGPGTVIGIWRESGVKGELTLADLSDGTLKFLCWATLCLAPRKAPLICIDAPELGLHPRVLPVLAGLLRQAAADSQLLVATHSPYFLSQFSLEEIAVMKKVEGRAVFARPASNEALRREIEELGSGELARLHISDELEVRS